MQSTYLITCLPTAEKMADAVCQLHKDVAAGYNIGQLFFYSDAVILGTLEKYPAAIQELLDIAEDNHIPLHLCSAGFQQRNYRLSALAIQDFSFKGLGQFIVESQYADTLRVF